MKILVTGAAGFVGFHLSQKLCLLGHEVIGIDNLNDYYSVALKKARLEILLAQPNFRFYPLNIAERSAMADFFEQHAFDVIVHLAAQAGVRYSLENPFAYVDSNLVGFMSMLEGARKQKNLQQFIFASSSSVYGENEKIPFHETDNVDKPISLYAATKKSNELFAYSYAHLYGFPCIGLRFFTVYGPWGRPDMAYFKFSEKIMREEVIDVYNQGDMRRDFTYIDDVVDGILKIISKNLEKKDPYRIYNIGRGSPANLFDFITILEKYLGKKAHKNFLPMQPGDVPVTFADTSALARDYDYSPKIDLEIGIAKFAEWFLQEYLEHYTNAASSTIDCA